MNFINKIKSAFTQQKADYLRNLNRINFSEAILIVSPSERIAIDFAHETSLLLSGFAGTAWITVQGHLTDYCLKNGEEIVLSVQGLLVIESMTTNVPTRVHVLIKDKAERRKSRERLLS